MTAKEQATCREDIERALWRWSEWQADQLRVDALLGLIDQYKLTADVLDPFLADIMAQAAADADQITAAARREAETMRPPPALCPGCEAAVKGAQASHQERANKPDRRRGKRPRVPETDRKCRDCGIVKGIDRFNRDVKSRNGRKAQCKQCEAGQRAERRTTSRAKAAGKRVLSIKV